MKYRDKMKRHRSTAPAQPQGSTNTLRLAARPAAQAPKQRRQLSPEEAARRAAAKAANIERERQAHLAAIARRRAEKADILERLASMFPAFGPVRPLPLAVGSHAEIAAALPDLPPWRVGKWLAWWTARKGYLIALKQPSSRRHGLDGQPAEGAAGIVTEEQRAIARQRLKALEAGQKKRAA